MTTPRVSIQQYERQQQIAGVTVAALLRLWSPAGTEFDFAYQQLRPRMVETLQLGRAASVHAAIPYTSDVLAETRQVGVPSGAVVPAAFLATAPNGLPVTATLDALPVKAKQAVGRGATALEARSAAGSWLSGIALTMLADTRRDVFQADIVSRPQVTGYVRMLNPPSCSRCVILAGKRFAWNQGFQRHPNCDCIHIPASEQVAGDFTTDPYEYFKSLSEKDQNRLFGKGNAQGVRDGADIFQVVNTSQRAVPVAGSGGRMVQYAGRAKPTLAQIYASDKDRRFVIENMRYHGYITGPQNPMGNIRGNDPVGGILAAGRGQGTYTVGGQVVTTNRAARFDAVTSGVRDPLNRSTMTDAERRLYDAHYRAQWADAGYRTNSVGANSADRGLGLRPISSTDAAKARETLQKYRANAYATDENGRYIQPDQVRELASLLGL